MTKIKKVTAGKGQPLRKKILIVDTDPAFRKLLEEIFTAHFDVTCVTNGEDAMKEFVANAPDLVITELVMPKIDGFMLINEITKVRKIPIIVTSTAVVGSSQSYLQEQGVFGFISKDAPEQIFKRTSEALTSLACSQVTWHKQR